jgi:hypothetical protein
MPESRPGQVQVGFSNPTGVVDKVDRHDLRAGDHEPHEGDGPAVCGRDDAGGSVDHYRQGDLSDSREGERALGYRRSTADYLSAVGAHDDVWVQGRQQRVEVAIASGGEKGVGDFPLPDQVSTRDRSYALDPPTGATGQLAGRGGRASDNGRDVIERDGEDVVQDECEPFGGRQRVQDYQ